MRAHPGTRIEEVTRLADEVEAEIRNVIPPDKILSSVDNISLPLSGINFSYSNSGTIGVLDADILLSLPVTAGGNSGRPLFTVSDIHRVRIYVNVPQAFLAGLKPGLAASLVLPQYPDEAFPAKLTTTSNSVTSDSRSALIELQADNPDGKLWPGFHGRPFSSRGPSTGPAHSGNGAILRTSGHRSGITHA